MNLEVEIAYSAHDDDWEVNVHDTDADERAEDLEKTFPSEEEANAYVDTLVQNKKYNVTHI